MLIGHQQMPIGVEGKAAREVQTGRGKDAKICTGARELMDGVAERTRVVTARHHYISVRFEQHRDRTAEASGSEDPQLLSRCRELANDAVAEIGHEQIAGAIEH
ncbi:MAG: hypothetical protein WDO74_32720 [Pseudomonadota bacterium]